MLGLQIVQGGSVMNDIKFPRVRDDFVYQKALELMDQIIFDPTTADRSKSSALDFKAALLVTREKIKK